jgi:hypothetical protein
MRLGTAGADEWFLGSTETFYIIALRASGQLHSSPKNGIRTPTFDANSVNFE